MSSRQHKNRRLDARIRKDEFDDSLTSWMDCRALWAAKLMCYLHDALQDRHKGQNLPPKIARGWFGTEDFYETCLCANVDAASVLATYHERLALTEQGKWIEALDGIAQKGRLNP